MRSWIIQATAAAATTMVVIVAGIGLSLFWLVVRDAQAPHPELLPLILFLGILPAYVISLGIAGLLAKAFRTEVNFGAVLGAASIIAIPVAYFAWVFSQFNGG